MLFGLVAAQLFKLNAAVAIDFAAFQPVCFNFFDDEGPRHVEEVNSFSRVKFVLLRHQLHRLPLSHLAQHFSKKAQSSERQLEQNETRLAALRGALADGESSGASTAFDVDAFLKAKRKMSLKRRQPIEC